jgi:hypothetical protein
MADRNFVLRVGLEGGQVVVRTLDEIGAKGDTALRRVGAAAKAEASPGLKAMAAAGGEADRALESLAARSGPMGAIFQSMGRGGLAAAAALGAVTLAAGFAGRAALDSIRRLDEMGDAAERAGVSFEVFQELGFALQKAGGEIEDVGRGLEGFLSKMGALRNGLRGGEQVEDALAVLGITKESLLALPSVEAQLAAIADGIMRVGDAATQAKIAEALGIEALLPVLKLGGEAMLELMSQARETGKTLSNELGQQAGETAEAIESANARMAAAWDRLAVAMAPAVATILGYMTSIAEKAVDAVSGVMQFLDNPNALADATGASSPVQRAQEALVAAQQTLTFARNQGFDDTGARQEVEAAQAALDEAVKQQALRDVRETIGEIIALVEGAAPPSAVADPPVFDGRPRSRRTPSSSGRRSSRSSAGSGGSGSGFADRARERASWRDDPSNFGAMLEDQEKVAERVAGSVTRYAEALGAARAALVGVDGASVAANSGLDLFDQAMRGRIRTLKDFGEALVEILANWIQLSARMAAEGKGTFFGNLGDILGNVFGGFLGSSTGPSAANWTSQGWKMFRGGRASGGPVFPGGAYLVGERGPELVSFGQAGMVHDAAATRRALAVPSSGPVAVTINNLGPPMSAETRQQRDGAGRMNIAMTLRPMVDEAVKGGLTEGRYDQSLRTRHGVMPQTKRR